ncbi:hypothetical protein V1508DRAFT_287664 [Lipomyces doorenjongii]|uniref:uncharacterized protein n=1 Tax=Lipomyces doorenjongii TaxID=383834 RepID=UPI0034CE4639
MEGSLSHDEIDNLLMHLFGINHSLTRYLPHLMPVSGTKDCRFCGVSWDKWEINNPSMCEYQSRLAHVKQRAQTAAKGHVRAMVENALDTAFKESPNFAWIRRPPFGQCLVKDFTDASGAAHLYKHSQNQSVCRVGACSVSLQGLWDWRAHAWEKHQIPFEGIIEEFVQWCDWLLYLVRRLRNLIFLSTSTMPSILSKNMVTLAVMMAHGLSCFVFMIEDLYPKAGSSFQLLDITGSLICFHTSSPRQQTASVCRSRYIALLQKPGERNICYATMMDPWE